MKHQVIVHCPDFSSARVASISYPDGVSWEVNRGVLSVLDSTSSVLATYNRDEWSRAEFSYVESYQTPHVRGAI